MIPYAPKRKSQQPADTKTYNIVGKQHGVADDASSKQRYFSNEQMCGISERGPYPISAADLEASEADRKQVVPEHAQ